VLALATTAAAACTSPDQVKPSPTNTGTVSPSNAGLTPAPSLGSEPAPIQVTKPFTTGPPAALACQGAVIHRLDASDTGPPWKKLCITVGGVLLVTNLGPWGFSTGSSDNVVCNYEAAVRECRLLHTGTVTFTIINAHQTRTLALVIAKASSPPKPSPACLADGATFIIDAADGGPDSWPVCMKMSGMVRIVNLGLDTFLASPSDGVACSYEAAVRECRFTRPETVTFTTTHGDWTPRAQTIVAIR
jgi:hypothetical protein